jgi:hypothetical protein
MLPEKSRAKSYFLVILFAAALARKSIMTSLKKISDQELKQKLDDELIYTVCVLALTSVDGEITVVDAPPFKPKWLRVRQVVYHDATVEAKDQFVVSLTCNFAQSGTICVFNNYSSDVSPQSVFKARAIGSSISFKVQSLGDDGRLVGHELSAPVGITIEFLG